MYSGSFAKKQKKPWTLLTGLMEERSELAASINLFLKLVNAFSPYHFFSSTFCGASLVMKTFKSVSLVRISMFRSVQVELALSSFSQRGPGLRLFFYVRFERMSSQSLLILSHCSEKLPYLAVIEMKTYFKEAVFCIDLLQ